ncbi:solute carrier family 6 member inebriated isoform 1-T6 [Glossina fuscipes fuscipes]
MEATTPASAVAAITETTPTTTKSKEDDVKNNFKDNEHNVVRLSKTVSTPTALNLGFLNKSPPTPTPNLGSVGKQGSVNFRHSLLYDSGAESCDNDDQTRLIRTPSVRSHKFIIIPASTPLGTPQQLSPTKSTPSLTGLQKLPLTRHSTVTDQRPMQASNPNLTDITHRAAINIASSTQASLAQSTSSPITTTAPGLIQRYSHSKYQTPFITPTLSLSGADVIHQTNGHEVGAVTTATSTAYSTKANTSVKFTIEDCESDSAAADDTTIATTTTITTVVGASNYTSIPAISSIYSANYFTLTPASTTTLSSSSPSVRTTVRPVSALLASNLTNTLTPGIDSRSRYDRNSSMRSVVSAFTPDSNELTVNSLIQPSSSSCGGGKDLNTNSYLLRDNIVNQIFSDVTSVRSLASIGIGSTDGRRLVIRRVPQTPNELLNFATPPSPQLPGVDDDDDDSFMDTSDETANLKPRKQKWGSKMQFVLACIGYSVGLGNVWRFPYMCYKSGGGVFLVPYCIILIICSIPLLFMELSIGQYTGRGPIGALGQLCPLFKGAGLASVVVSFLMSTYYSVIIGYSIYYFFTSFKPEMPWVDCNNRWNTPDCWVPQRFSANITAPVMSRTPTEEFFENKVLQISPGIEFPGLMRWELFACLICAWLMVYFATWKSIKSSAKVRYFTATFPFVLIVILMCRAVTLEGASDGLRYFFRPNWAEIKNANVWINAASQNFNSLGITFGSMISFASYNKYNNNILRDTVAVGIVNVLTSLLVGIFAFATLGNLALEQNSNVRNVIGDGPGLIFVVYPQAMVKMPYTQLWAVMFFFMLLCLGLNSQFAIIEVVVTSIQDGFPNWIKRHLGYHEIVVLIVCVISFLFGLPNLIQGGIYFFQLMDHYAASVTIMFLAFCQMIAIAWFYGIERLSKNIKQMTGKAPSPYLKSCWITFGPCLLFAIWILSLINYKEPSYHNGHYKYPNWAFGIGWMFASFSLVCIPGYALINLLRAPGQTIWERFKVTLHPNIYECKICGEHHCEHDYPEQEQYMLQQELAALYKPQTQGSPQHTYTMKTGQKFGYSPMHLQTATENTKERHVVDMQQKEEQEELAEAPNNSLNATNNEQR